MVEKRKMKIQKSILVFFVIAAIAAVISSAEESIKIPSPTGPQNPSPANTSVSIPSDPLAGNTALSPAAPTFDFTPPKAPDSVQSTAANVAQDNAVSPVNAENPLEKKIADLQVKYTVLFGLLALSFIFNVYSFLRMKRKK